MFLQNMTKYFHHNDYMIIFLTNPITLITDKAKLGFFHKYLFFYGIAINTFKRELE